MFHERFRSIFVLFLELSRLEKVLHTSKFDIFAAIKNNVLLKRLSVFGVYEDDYVIIRFRNPTASGQEETFKWCFLFC